MSVNLPSNYAPLPTTVTVGRGHAHMPGVPVISLKDVSIDTLSYSKKFQPLSRAWVIVFCSTDFSSLCSDPAVRRLHSHWPLCACWLLLKAVVWTAQEQNVHVFYHPDWGTAEHEGACKAPACMN